MSEDLDLDLSSLVCFNFYVGWRKVASVYRNVLGKSVSPQKIYILETCDPGKKITVWEVAQEIGLDSSAISTMISRMEKSGWVFRTHDTEDRRKVFVQLTEEGVRVRAQFREKYQELIDRINKDLTDQEKAMLKTLVNKLADN